MPLPPPEDTARRVRAAFAYADMDVTKSVPGISPATMARIVSAASPRGLKTEAELDAIVAGTTVPRNFFLYGFALDEPTLAERVESIERRLDAAAQQAEAAARGRQGLTDAEKQLVALIRTLASAPPKGRRNRSGP